MRQKQTVVLITGASSGIGRACSEYLAPLGYAVYGTSRQIRDPLRVDIADASYNMIPMDVTDQASVDAAMDYVLAQEGRLDALVNNAGIGISGAIEDTSLDEARTLFETNFFGVVRLCRSALPLLREQGGGYIVNMSSLGGRIAQPFQAFYSASKFAVEGFTEALRMEVAPLGIRVSMIEPGDFCTGFTRNRCYVKGATEQSPYCDRLERVMKVIENDETNGSHPELVARLLHRILSDPSPRLRYPVGALFQKVVPLLKTVLPGRFFEWGLCKYYGA